MSKKMVFALIAIVCFMLVSLALNPSPREESRLVDLSDDCTGLDYTLITQGPGGFWSTTRETWGYDESTNMYYLRTSLRPLGVGRWLDMESPSDSSVFVVCSAYSHPNRPPRVFWTLIDGSTYWQDLSR